MRKKTAVKLGLAAGFLLFQGLLVLTASTDTPPIRNSEGKVLPNSIAEFEWVTLGGVKQRLLVRGVHANNPVLLVVHGGPGAPEFAALRHFNGELERHFTVVHWEQRGAGRSFDESLSSSDVNLERIIADLDELVTLLKQRFGQNRIYLLAHSWGTIIGALYARDHPENLAAYIGVGQSVWPMESEDRAYDFLVAEAAARKDADMQERLAEMGRPPHSLFQMMSEHGYIDDYGGALRYPGGAQALFFDLWSEPEMSWLDVYLYARGAWFSISTLADETKTINLMDSATRFAVPVYFTLGRYDHQVDSKLAAEYFDLIQAPSKRLMWFENSAHNPNVEEPDLFNKFMVETVLGSR